MGIFGIEEANEADARLFTRLMKEECWKRVPGPLALLACN